MDDELDELYCTIFVDTLVTQQELVRRIAEVVDGHVRMRTIYAPSVFICVHRNEDFDDRRRREPDDGFLFFRFYLEVDAEHGQVRAAQIRLVAQLLEYFWASGMRAVAACDYEDELPRKGGIMSVGEN